MTQGSKPQKTEQITLFVCSEGQTCDQATTFVRGWANGCSDIPTAIISIANQPEQVVRFGITHTPALVIDDHLIAQDLSINKLAELLQLHQSKIKMNH